MIRSLYRIFKRLGGLVTYVFLLVLRCPVDTVLCIINALFTKGVFQAMEAGDLAGLQESCLKFVIANFCLFFYNGIVWSEFAMFSARFVGKLRSFVFDSMFLLPLEKIEEKTNGAWLTRMNSDVRMTLNLLTGAVNIPHAVFAIVRITVSSILLGTICPELLVAELATLLPHVFLRQNLVVRPMERLIKKAQEHTEQTMVYLSAMVECADTVRLYGADQLLLERYRESSLCVVKARLQMNLRKAFGELLHPLFGRGGYLLLFFLGCEMIQSGKMEFGTLTAAFQYRGAMLMGSMMLLNSLVEVKKNSVGLKRMEEIYGAEE